MKCIYYCFKSLIYTSKDAGLSTSHSKLNHLESLYKDSNCIGHIYWLVLVVLGWLLNVVTAQDFFLNGPSLKSENTIYLIWFESLDFCAD